MKNSDDNKEFFHEEMLSNEEADRACRLQSAIGCLKYGWPVATISKMYDIPASEIAIKPLSPPPG